MPTHKEQLQKIWRQYEEAGQPVPASAHQVAEWAIRERLWMPHPGDIVRQCAEELADAYREEYFTDSQGRRVRAKHAARVKRRGEQLVLWADMRTAPRSHMELAFQQRRRQALGECRQLKTDVDSYNDAHAAEPPIQMIFDFTKDLEEDAA